MSESVDATRVAPRFTQEAKMQSLVDVFGAEYAKDFNDPVVFIEVELSSPTAKQFFKREFPLVSRTLIVESVYRRRPSYNQSVLDDFAAMSAKKLADILRLLSLNCERMRLLCKSNQVDVDATFMRPSSRLVPIIASHAKTYLMVLQKLDELYHLTASANLNGIIDGKARMSAEQQNRKAVRAYSAMLRAEITKLWRESQRMRSAQGDAPDEELSLAEASHSKAVAAFDTDSSNEAQTDPDGHVSPELAAQVIDDLTALGTASAKSKRGKKAEAGEGDQTPADVIS